MPLYLALLFKVMKEQRHARGLHRAGRRACSAIPCYNENAQLDDEGRLRADRKELDPAIQREWRNCGSALTPATLAPALGFRRLQARVPATVRLRGGWRRLRRRRQSRRRHRADGLIPCSSTASRFELNPRVRRLVAPNPGVMTGPGTNTYLLGR
jgi:hypothetical protein